MLQKFPKIFVQIFLRIKCTLDLVLYSIVPVHCYIYNISPCCDHARQWLSRFRLVSRDYNSSWWTEESLLGACFRNNRERYFATLQELRLFPFTISISNYTISVVLLPHNVSHNVSLESRIYLCTNSFLIRTVEYNPTRKLMR